MEKIPFKTKFWRLYWKLCGFPNLLGFERKIALWFVKDAWYLSFDTSKHPVDVKKIEKNFQSEHPESKLFGQINNVEKNITTLVFC